MNEIRFSSVKDAVRWSEELLSRSKIRSNMSMWQSSGSGSSAMLTGNEAEDIAQTITMLVAQCKPWSGLATRIVYSTTGTAEDERNIGIVIASDLIDSKESIGKHYEKLIKLGICAIKARKAEEIYARRYPLVKEAKLVGIRRETFYKSKDWKRLRELSRQYLTALINSAETKIYSELSIRGWI